MLLYWRRFRLSIDWFLLVVVFLFSLRLSSYAPRVLLFQVMIDFKKSIQPTLAVIFVRHRFPSNLHLLLLLLLLSSDFEPHALKSCHALVQFCTLLSSMVRPDYNTIVALFMMVVVRQGKEENMKYVRNSEFHFRAWLVSFVFTRFCCQVSRSTWC